MKINVGSKLSLYPMPLVVVGTMNGDKPTWTLVAHTGIIGHDHILVSLYNKHFINELIKNNKTFSVNICSKDILSESDYCGISSGNTIDKSNVFEYTVTNNSIPVIEKSKLVMECAVESNYELSGFDNFICTIIATHVEEECITNDKIDYTKVAPILFDMPNYQYYELGKIIGKGTTFGKEYGKNN